MVIRYRLAPFDTMPSSAGGRSRGDGRGGPWYRHPPPGQRHQLQLSGQAQTFRAQSG